MTTDRFAEDKTAWIPRAERPEALPTALAALAGAGLTALLYLAAQADAIVVFAAAVLVVQLLLVAAWSSAARPPAPIGVAAVGAGSALLADGVLAFGQDASVGPLAGVIAAAFGATIVAQLVRGESRRQVTEAFGSTLALVACIVALATMISLHRHSGGRPLLTACLWATGAGLVVARLTDLVLPTPPVNVLVSRGAFGILAGSLVGALAGVISPSITVSLVLAALAGWGVALAAILADVGVGFAAAGRAIVEQSAQPSPWRPLLGPLLGVSVAAPAGYVFSLVLFA